MNLKNILQFSIGPLGSAILGLITLPITAWLFTPEDIGRLSMMQVTVSFSLLIFSLGLDQAFVREYHEESNKPALLKAVVLPGLIFLGIVITVLIILPLSISQMLFGVKSALLSSLLFIAVLLAFISRFLSLVLRMQERGLAFSMSQVLPKLIFLIVIGFYILISAKAVFVHLMLAQVISLSSVFCIFAFNTKKQWIPAINANIDKKKLKQMIRYALPLIGGGLAFWGLTATDKLFLRSMSSFEEIGIYSVAFSFAGTALIMQSIFSTVWAPIVYRWDAEGIDPQRVKNVMDYITLAVIIIWSLAGMLSWVVGYLLPPKYDRVKYILIVAMAYPLLYTLSEATGVGIGIKKKTLYAMLAAILALIINLILNYILIPTYGAAGAAIASAVAFMAFFIVRTEASARIWVSFERIKMYVLLTVGIVLSILVNVCQVFEKHIVIFEFVYLLFGLAAYKKQVHSLCSNIKKKIEFNG